MLPSAETLGPFLWRSSLLIGAAYLLNAVLFRRCPANRYTVLVIVVLLLPMIWISAHAPLSLFSSDGDAYLHAEPVINEIVLKSRQWNAPGDWIAGQVKVEEAGRAGGFDIERFLLPLWLAGMCVFMLRHLGHQIRLEGLVRRARPVREGFLHQCFIRIRNFLGASPRIRLLEADSLPGPAAAGIFFPAVFLPAGLKGEQGSGLDETLAHEILHHKRRDLLFHHITVLVRSIFWFHPLVFLVHRSLGVERERAVDLAVIEALGDSDGYIHKLHETARRVAISRLPAARATALLGARASVIRRRIKMLLNHTRYHTARRPVLFTTSLVLVFGLTASFLAIGSCLGPETAKGDEESVDSSKPDKTIVVGIDKEGGYRLMNGFDSVSKVVYLPWDKMEKPTLDKLMKDVTEENVTILDPGKDWTFEREKQCLKLREPVDMKKYGILVYGKRSVPWIFSAMDIDRSWEIMAVGTIEPGSVRITIEGRKAVLGEDYEVDYENGFIRMLKEEICKTESGFDLRYSCHHPGIPNFSRGIHFGRGDPKSEQEINAERKEFGLPVYEPDENVDRRDVERVSLWKTADPAIFIPKRPVLARGFKLSVRFRKGKLKDTRFLERDVDFRFNDKKQMIVLDSADLFDPEKQYISAWGIPEDNSTYQFPGPIEKGSVHYLYEDVELKEGSDFTVDYERNRVSLRGRVFSETVLKRGQHMEIIYRHVIEVGEWKIRNYPEGM